MEHDSHADRSRRSPGGALRRGIAGCWGACLACLLVAGCASVRPLDSSATSPLASPSAPLLPGAAASAAPVAPASLLAELKPPKIELPDWQPPRLDLAAFSPERRMPSNDRDWIPEQRVLARAEIGKDSIRVHNVRNAQFFSYRDCLVDYYDKTYDLTKIRTVDFLMVPFADNRAIAHTLLSFGFEGGDYVGVSVEVRLEQGESYSAAIGLFGQFELMYVVADERDLLPVRPQYRGVDVLLYHTKATPAQARDLFVDVMRRVNHLADHPEFYDTLRNNCTTNIVRHINDLAPGRVPYDYRVLLPGYADSLAYDLGLIDTALPFEDTRRRARITDAILKYKDDPRFSERIRGQ